MALTSDPLLAVSLNVASMIEINRPAAVLGDTMSRRPTLR
jgi:hypothetical protein